MNNQCSEDDCAIQIRSSEERLVEHLLAIEKLCMRLRQCVLPEISGLKEAVFEPSLVNEVNNLKIDVSSLFFFFFFHSFLPSYNFKLVQVNKFLK
ncbi:unnamed protein product [Gongylonema pulchrum]|uniref:Uncharacterized protein n=1 Tax=Gongylonema pulchrum TaxID=637853 RepID=A0A183EGY7_9BILA|nr:unnamed protein product [Gongylonema pulchrum]